MLAIKCSIFLHTVIPRQMFSPYDFLKTNLKKEEKKQRGGALLEWLAGLRI
jgi:hypothetical protein